MTTRTARAKAALGQHDLRYPAHAKLTPEQLHARAIERQAILHHRYKEASAVLSPNELVRLFDNRAPHANRATAERKHFDRRPAKERTRKAYFRGLLNNERGLHANGRPMPLGYVHSYARAMLEEAARLPMAA